MADRMPHSDTPTESLSAALLERLACPRCDAALTVNLACPACQATYPIHQSVPWLVADPAATRLEWKNRWQMALRDLEARQQSARESLKQAGAEAPEATIERLTTLADGYAAQHRALKLLLSDLGLAGGADLETYLALKTRLPTQMGLMAYEANVFRDWVWGAAENAASLEALTDVLGAENPGATLVLGAGAGRLAYDLHQSRHASGATDPEEALTVALELNPYLTTVNRRLASGDSVDLVEFPLAPDSGAHAAIARTLQAPAAALTGFEVVLADVMRPPFQPGTFDTVITPWLLDVIDGDTGTLLRLLNRLLRPGGRWVFHGSLAFQRAAPLDNLNLAELEALAGHSGFEISQCGERVQPYLDCPESRHGRRESVITLCARKAHEVEAPARAQSLPDWIARGRTPIPLLPAFQSQAMATRVHAFIMSLIDGKRSLKDMAAVMEAQQLMPKDEAETAIRGFLIKMFEEAGSGRGL